MLENNQVLLVHLPMMTEILLTIFEWGGQKLA